MISEISFTIHWSWVIWTVTVIALVALVGGIGYLIGETRGRSWEANRSSTRSTGIGR